MNTLDRFKILIKNLIALGIAENQRELGRRLGYTESAFSQIVNGKVNYPSTMRYKLRELDARINPDWVETGAGEMLHPTAITSSIVGNVGDGSTYTVAPSNSIDALVAEIAKQREVTETAQKQITELIDIIKKLSEK